MDDHIKHEEGAAAEVRSTFISTHRFMVLVIGAIIVALILVVISMRIYSTSGAAQLDLSRPGYRSVSSQAVSSDETFMNFPDSGPLMPSDYTQFLSTYDTQSQSIKGIDSFGGDPLNADDLDLGAN